MSQLPTGTVTFLFTDVEDSTPLLQRLGANRYRKLIDEHAEIVRKAIAEAGGFDLSTAGDSFFAVFESAPAAVGAAVGIQQALEAHLWPDDGKIRVRIGIHTGEGSLGGDNYVGLDVNIAARIEAAGHGGQILISGATAGLIHRSLSSDSSLTDLGQHRLKGIAEPEQLFQINASGLQTQFPTIRTLDARPTNLPVQLTNFIGRETVIEQIVSLLGDARLLTLTGPGGTGKTRLSLQVAAQMLDHFTDGVFFVALAAIHDQDLFATAVASALSVKELPGMSIGDSVNAFLAEKEILLVLDNFEQILPAAAQVAKMLSSARNLKVIATSREPLHISGEQEFQVPTLDLPDPRKLPPLSALSEYDAVALFVQRARTVDPTFTVTKENAPAVAELATRLDGLPLAIELAAARAKILSPDAMLACMGDRFGLLQSGKKDLPQRQTTLRDAIAWSFDLLDDEERALFTRLGIFVGGFTFESAQVVAGQSGDIDLLDLISSLLDKSLIRQDRSEKEKGRFTMLETIREFASDQLNQSGEFRTVAKRHAMYFAELAKELGPKLESPEAMAALAKLQSDYENLRAAFSYLVETKDAETAMAMIGRTWRYFHFKGHFSDGRQMLQSVLDTPEAKNPTLARAEALVGLAGIVYWQSDYALAETFYAEALEIYRATGDLENIGWVLYCLSTTYEMRSDFQGALTFAEEAVETYKKSRDRKGLAIAESDLGWIQVFLGKLENSRAIFEDAVSILREFGDTFNIATANTGLTYVDKMEGKYDDAVAHALESQSLFRELGDMTGVLMCVNVVADLAIDLGDCSRAIVLAAAAEAMREKLGGGAPPENMHVREPREICKGTISDEEIEIQAERGRALSMDELLELCEKPFD